MDLNNTKNVIPTEDGNTGIISNIQRFSIHDGPGIRTAVFFKGCNMRCRWCHNPENVNFRPQVYYEKQKCMLCGKCAEVCRMGCHSFTENGHIFNSEKCIGCTECVDVCNVKALTLCGKRMSADEILGTVMSDSAFYGETGGITITGGEPLAQGDFAIELLKKSKEAGITTCVETAGYFKTEYVEKLCKYSDYLLWDIKDSDRDRHCINTGVYPDLIIENLKIASGICADKITVRAIMINGITDSTENRQAILRLCNENGIKNCVFFPFHPYGNGKKDGIGDYSSERMGKSFIPQGEYRKL